MSSRNGRRARRFHHLPFMPLTNGKGGAPAGRFAGSVPPVIRRTGAAGSTRSTVLKRTADSTVCTCASPLVPGWPDAAIKIAAISAAGFWQAVEHPCVFRLVDVADASAEEEAAIDAGMFVLLVRPDREDADVKALVDVLREQGGPIYGEPVDFSGRGETIMQIVAVLID